MCDLVPLSHLHLDVPAPAAGWRVELDRRGIATVVDDLGRPCISRSDVRELLDEDRANEARKARRRAAAEAAAVAADREWRAGLPSGIPAGAVPEGLTAAALMMAADPMDQRPRRESVLEHALANRDGAVFRPVGGGS